MTTPIRRQYLDLKKRHPDAILFFRLGDFYETFDEDAELVARELDIVLTSKPMGKGIRVPLAGVPYHSIEGHVAKLVKRGHRVAICEQMADPASVKGLVPREVVRTVTAGTVTSEAALSAETPNELAALVERGGEQALALADVTTGEVRVATGQETSAELARSTPAELLIEEEGLHIEGAGCEVMRPRLSAAASSALVAAQYGESAPKTLVGGEAAIAAVAQLLAYLGEVYPESKGALGQVRKLASDETVALDGRTLLNLEVLPTSDDRPSLFGVLNRTRSAMGARLLGRWLAHPLQELASLEKRHDAVTWAVDHPIEQKQAQAILKGIPDVARLCGRLGARAVTPRELSGLRQGLQAGINLSDLLERAKPPVTLLANSKAALLEATETLSELREALAEDPPITFDEGGVIAPGHDEEIDKLRHRTQTARQALLALEASERERTGIRSLKVGQNKVFGYYLEVSLANAQLVPKHYQRRQTLVGAERYVTEELQELESGMTTSREQLAARERQAFEALVERVGTQLDALQRAAEGIATIDVALGLAEVAAEQGYVRPAFEVGTQLAILRGRHPVVEAALGPGRFIPNDCVLGESGRILLLTGPNMSGKSTYLRQVALIALMAQAGSFVPAQNAVLPLFDRIFTRIGAHDDLAAGQSTFMVEMVETAQILHRATDRSLVILDEVGRGTSTFDGMAIARAVLEFLDARSKGPPRTLFATHYHELTAVVEELDSADNAHVAVHDDAGTIVFEHRIEPGPSDRSYGIHVAQLAGLPAAVVKRAQKLLDELEEPHPQSQRREVVPRDPGIQNSLFDEQIQDKITSALAEIDLESMTPLEAMAKLGELREQARRKE
ncbi:MAG: DNA mismatch repair protein MutS [Dehalococcoidia bacterium]|nr:DNA mismatch repair protein MutS [Dehalococcoidia bacterium]